MSNFINENASVQTMAQQNNNMLTRVINNNTTKENDSTQMTNDKNAPQLGQHNDSNKKTAKNNDNNGFAVIISVLSGASAGALAKSSIAPLDRAKINFQINKDIPYSFRAATIFLINSYKNEGLLALWRGNSATMARIIPYAAIHFTAHEQWRKVLQVDKDGSSTSVKRFIAGSLAGITSQSLTYPLDLARARMAVTDKYSNYKTLRHVFIRIWVDEGPRTLVRGYWATILGVIPYAGTSFFTYETLKKKYFEITGDKKPPSMYSLVFGAIAGALGQTSSYPLDIVRRRMQTHAIIDDQYKTIWSSIKTIYRYEGIIGGFYKGLSMNWIKGPIAVGMSFSTYEFFKDLLEKVLL